MVARFCVFSTLLLSTSAQAGDSPLRPTGAWTVDYGSSQCVASRHYGTDERPTYLILKPSPLGGVMRLAVVQKGRAPLAQTSGKVQFDSSPAISTGMLTYTDDRYGNWAASTNIPMADFRANRPTSSIRIWGSSLSKTFVVSKLPEVSAQLEKCLLSLQGQWNIAVGDRSAKIVQEASPKSRTVFSWRDYPWEALRDGKSGSVKVVFLVDENGKVSDCSVDETSGIPSLDAMSCWVLQARSEFNPALGPDGKPAKSAYCYRIRWQLAGGKVPAPPPIDPRCPQRT